MEMFILLNSGRLSVTFNRPSLGTWTSEGDLLQAITQENHAVNYFCDVNFSDSESKKETLQRFLYTLEDGEVLESWLKDFTFNQESVEYMYSILEQHLETL